MPPTMPPPPQPLTEHPDAPPSRHGLTAFAWLWVGLPLVYGLYELVQKATQLFTG